MSKSREVGFVVKGVRQSDIDAATAACARRLAQITVFKAEKLTPPRPLLSPEKRKYRRATIFGPSHIRSSAEEAKKLAAKSGFVRITIEEIGGDE